MSVYRTIGPLVSVTFLLFQCYFFLLTHANSPIKWIKLPSMTISVDWDVKQNSLSKKVLNVNGIVLSCLWGSFYCDVWEKKVFL